MPLDALIIDDEKPARDELMFLLKAFPEVSVVAQGKNGVEAVTLIKEHSPHMVFLDVQMPGLDGFGVIQKLMDRKMKLPHIIFATAYDHYAVQAFEVNAVDYLRYRPRQACPGRGYISGRTAGDARQPDGHARQSAG